MLLTQVGLESESVIYTAWSRNDSIIAGLEHVSNFSVMYFHNYYLAPVRRIVYQSNNIKGDGGE